ncbi:inner membrane protein [Escherichia coli]|uniref:Inner membrane protein n=1 Tax=Escherichia coli TaxID=562 RepID=A0A376UBZ6_ECOLX|nr:inner membrane protein [Escherichia coli]
MNQSLTLAFLIAAGIGLVVQNTLMVRITQTSSTILIAMLLNSLVGIVLFVSIYGLNKAWRGLANWCPACAGGHLYPACWDRFCLRQYQRISECGSGDNYCSTGRQPANWRSDAGYLPQSWRTTTGVVRPNLWRNFTCGWRLVGSQTLILIRGWCRLWLTVRGALPYLLYACDRDEQ